MKLPILALIAAAFLSGCASKTTPRTPPSVGRVKQNVADAEASVTRAAESSARVGTGIDSSRRIADRIDAKATVVLKYWR